MELPAASNNPERAEEEENLDPPTEEAEKVNRPDEEEAEAEAEDTPTNQDQNPPNDTQESPGGTPQDENDENDQNEVNLQAKMLLYGQGKRLQSSDLDFSMLEFNLQEDGGDNGEECLDADVPTLNAA